MSRYLNPSGFGSVSFLEVLEVWSCGSGEVLGLDIVGFTPHFITTQEDLRGNVLMNQWTSRYSIFGQKQVNQKS